MIAASMTLSPEYRKDLWLISNQVVQGDAMASRGPRPFVYSGVQPVAMDRQFLG